MLALLARHRSDVSAVESVDQPAQLAQIAKAAEIAGTVTSGIRWRSLDLLRAPIGPVGGNE
jgi:hypothetical protein